MLVATLLSVSACHPAEQGRSTSALLTRSSNALTIQIPSCKKGAVGRFDVFANRGRSYSMRRGKGVSETARLVTLEITDATLASRDFGPEVKLLGTDGAAIEHVSEITDIYLNTDVGYVEFDPNKVSYASDGRAILKGQDSGPASTTDTADALLTGACK